ncbi:glycosyltransferase family 2 protein [uncultured Duncaniella sp.]|uniref:glycosyltransferase family 2 protein n=1 Tax=uncultured Duncaniella sp. TaxID=2768039 RepID=UPI0025D84F75|nr:glycosyltransferase family 2 protein [uncultured Duncaniella sp.]
MKISIITATFNSGATLRDTLESVLRQTHRDVEHIIKDGGSSDNTLEIAESFRRRYADAGKSLVIMSERDGGLYDAMNKGIDMASGDVIGILNSDDFYTSDDILSTVEREIEGFDAVYGDVHYVKSPDLGRCVRYYSSRAFRPWKMRMGYMPAHPSFYCRRRVYALYGKFDTSFKVAADFEQLLRLIFINRIAIRYISKDFVTMRTGGVSSSGLQSHRKIFADHMRAYRKNKVHSCILFEGIRYADRIIEKILRLLHVTA